MLTYRYVDDGWYCQSWWIEENGKRFAEAFSEADAQEICQTLNAVRRLTRRIKAIADLEHLGKGRVGIGTCEVMECWCHGVPVDELPFQTFERIFGVPWPGGESAKVRSLLVTAGITFEAGTEEANLALQKWLLETHVEA